MTATKEDKASRGISALSDALVEDIQSLTDDALIAELREDGLDPHHVAAHLRSQALESVTQFRRTHLEAAKRALKSGASPRHVKARPQVSVIRQRVTALFTNNTGLSVAFRNGQKQSDADWMSLWDDLVELNLVHDDEPEY